MFILTELKVCLRRKLLVYSDLQRDHTENVNTK